MVTKHQGSQLERASVYKQAVEMYRGNETLHMWWHWSQCHCRSPPRQWTRRGARNMIRRDWSGVVKQEIIIQLLRKSTAWFQSY